MLRDGGRGIPAAFPVFGTGWAGFSNVWKNPPRAIDLPTPKAFNAHANLLMKGAHERL
jgi:hypothetical protein